MVEILRTRAEKEIFAFACCIWEEESQVGNDIHVIMLNTGKYTREKTLQSEHQRKTSLNSEFWILNSEAPAPPWPL